MHGGCPPRSIVVRTRRSTGRPTLLKNRAEREKLEQRKEELGKLGCLMWWWKGTGVAF